MVAYIIKVTVIWTVLLLLYEALYHKTAKHAANRLYLLGSILLGVILPLLPIGLSINMQPLDTINTLTVDNVTLAMTAANVPSTESERVFQVSSLVSYSYSLGAIVFLMVSFGEFVKIMRKAIYGKYQLIEGRKVFSSATTHAPFSFMGWVFVSRPEHYSADELRYILNHEQAHNHRKHWLDIVLLQFVLIAFWFHPLVWRYRYLLKLAHEYEADEIAANGNAYDYGHFLLQQVLLKGTPSIAHSFHFSPIKNRINMLTQNRSHKNWKYFAIVPALLCCTILMAKSSDNTQRVKVGNKTTYKGNDFYWTEHASDTVEVVNSETGEQTQMVMGRNPSINKVNNEAIIESSSLSNEPSFRFKNTNFREYLDSQLKKLAKHIPDSVAQIQVNNLVINKKGKIIYFDMLYINTNVGNGMSGMSFNNAALDPIFEKIIADCPVWSPGTKEGKAALSFVPAGGAISLKTVSMRARHVGNVKKGVDANGTEIIQSENETYTFPKQ